VVEIAYPQAATAREAHAHLSELFPAAGHYFVKAETGRLLDVELNGPASWSGDPLEIWRHIFPAAGRYELRKARPMEEGAHFQEWFLERLAADAEANFGNLRRLVRKMLENYLQRYNGHLTDPGVLEQLEHLLFDARQAVRWSLAMPVSLPVEQRLRELGLTDQDVLDFPGLAYRLGLLEREAVLPSAGSEQAWTHLLRTVRDVQVTHSDEAAILYARQRAAQYLSPVLLRDGQAMTLEIQAREIALTRELTAEAVRQEMHPRALARQLYKRLGLEEGIQRDFDRVARTEIQEARVRGAFEGERRARGWTATTLVYRIVAAHPCNGCIRLYVGTDGMPKRYKVRELEREDAQGLNRGPWRTWHARIGPTHPHCVPGDGVVLARGVQATSERWYAGDVITLRTVNGHALTCTPNHPVLTGHGWVPAGLVDEGSEVVCDRRREREVAPRYVDSDHMPARMVEVVKAFGQTLAVTAVPVPLTAEDFHGDGEGSKIAIVRANRLLGDSCDPALAQQVIESAFQIGGQVGTALATSRFPDQLVQRLFPPVYSCVCGMRLGLALLGGLLRRAGLLGGMTVAERLARFAQATADDRPRHTVVSGQPEHGTAGSIAGKQGVDREVERPFPAAFGYRGDRDPRSMQDAGDRQAVDADQPCNLGLRVAALMRGERGLSRVIRKSSHWFEGMVYNLTTEDHFYLADGVVVHNCVCSPWLTWTDPLGHVFAPRASQWRETMRRRGLLGKEEEAA
jgi:hypothetical protein